MLSSSERSAALPESVANTDFPRLCRSFAAATPLRAIPTINTISSGLPQFQGRKTEQCKDQRHDPEADDDFRFRPSSQFEVMVYRRHSENPLSAQLERQHLDHHRQSFDDEYPTDKHQQQFLFDDHSDGSNRSSECERPNVPHEYLRGMGVVPEEAQARTDNGSTEDRDLFNS